MKKCYFIFQIVCVLIFGCKKKDNLSDAERKIIGTWQLVQKIIEEPGQTTDTIKGQPGYCYISFYTGEWTSIGNLKYVEDKKDCLFLIGGGWKIEGNTRLVLEISDTTNANILTSSHDSLVFKADPHRLLPTKTITYSFIKL